MKIPFLIFLSFYVGDITQKGYEKKKQRLLGPYMSASVATNNNNGSTSAGQGQSQGENFYNIKVFSRFHTKKSFMFLFFTIILTNPLFFSLLLCWLFNFKILAW